MRTDHIMERMGWKWLTGDMSWEDYGGTWYKPSLHKALTYFLLRFENMEEWGDGAKGYSCEVLLVNLVDLDHVELTSALKSCGWRMDKMNGGIYITNDYNGDIVASGNDVPLAMLSACVGYGCFAVLDGCTGTHPMHVRAEARRCAETYIKDTAALEAELDRPANRISSTKRDCARGDSLAGLHRAAEAVISGDESSMSPQMSLMLRMYGAAEGHTLGGEVLTDLALAGKLLKEKG